MCDFLYFIFSVFLFLQGQVLFVFRFSTRVFVEFLESSLVGADNDWSDRNFSTMQTEALSKKVFGKQQTTLVPRISWYFPGSRYSLINQPCSTEKLWLPSFVENVRKEPLLVVFPGWFFKLEFPFKCKLFCYINHSDPCVDFLNCSTSKFEGFNILIVPSELIYVMAEMQIIFYSRSNFQLTLKAAASLRTSIQTITNPSQFSRLLSEKFSFSA